LSSAIIALPGADGNPSSPSGQLADRPCAPESPRSDGDFQNRRRFDTIDDVTDSPAVRDRLVVGNLSEFGSSASLPTDHLGMPIAPDRRNRELLIIYGTSLCVGLHLALIQLTIFRKVSEALFVAVASLAYATVAWILWQWVLPRFAEYGLWRRTGYQFVVTLLCFLALSVVTIEVHAWLLGGSSFLRPYEGGARTITIPREALRRAPLIYALIPVVPTALLCVVGFNQHYWRILVLKGRQVALQELAVSAQLAALRAQVNPHFLFNSLNSIAQLITVDPAKAEACVERLGEIYRYLLQRAHSDFVPLADELRVAEAYLEIEHARFGDNLIVEEKIDAPARTVLLPSLILQPLVENAVKHGISPKLGGGRITIEAHVENGDLRLAVSDTGVGVKQQATMFDRGVGLSNVRDRILHLYGTDYLPEVRSSPDRGTTVTLRIPTSRGA
jgi:two-component sensor histidine kinase